MPPSHRRLALTLAPEVDQMLREIAEISGASPASFVSGLLFELLPQLQTIKEGLLQAQKSREDAFKALQAMVTASHSQVEQMDLAMAELKPKVTRTRGMGRPSHRKKKTP